jgi:hypothetical protein
MVRQQSRGNRAWLCAACGAAVEHAGDAELRVVMEIGGDYCALERRN